MLSKKLHFSAYISCYHYLYNYNKCISYNMFVSAVILQYIYFVLYSTHCTLPIIQNNYFNIRHVLNEQLNHSLEFSAPMSFKFVTNIYIALPLYKVISFRFSMTKLFFFLLSTSLNDITITF